MQSWFTFCIIIYDNRSAGKNNYLNSTEIIVLGPVLLNISPAG